MDKRGGFADLDYTEAARRAHALIVIGTGWCGGIRAEALPRQGQPC